MKRIIVTMLCFIPGLVFCANNDQTNINFQELCLKEQDPVKRHNYCYMLTKPHVNKIILEEYQLNRAVG